MTTRIGPNSALVKAGTTTDGVGAEYDLGTIWTKEDGSTWMYVQAAEAITQYMCVSVSTLGQASKLTSAAALLSPPIGVAQVAFADNDFGWVCLDPAGNNGYKIGVLSACDSGADLATSATAGYLDDAYTTFVPLVGPQIATTLASTGGATWISSGRIQLFLRTSGV